MDLKFIIEVGAPKGSFSGMASENGRGQLWFVAPPKPCRLQYCFASHILQRLLAVIGSVFGESINARCQLSVACHGAFDRTSGPRNSMSLRPKTSGRYGRSRLGKNSSSVTPGHSGPLPTTFIMS
jgi:hypothetical protein